MTLLDAALDAAGRGWRVFPLVAGRKTPRKALTDWERKATCDADRIARWWERHPADNVGIACGPSGLVVVDLDVIKDGDTPPERWPAARGGSDALAALADQRGHQLEATWTVSTPSGGRHLYYQAPEVRRLRNTAGRIGWRIDTRAHGGYVVGAGSIVGDCRYVLDDPTPPVPLPDWLVELVDPPPTATPSAGPARPTPRARGYVETALANEVQRVLEARPGTRNDTLYRAGLALSRFVDQGALPAHVVEAALQQAGEATGLPASSVAATIRSALTARQRRRGAAQ